jgi:beta-glucanase (GH16 family)
MPVGNLPGWRQTVADDFTGGSLPADFYQSAYEGHPSNDPSQGTWLPSHVVVTNGMLELRDYQDPASNDPQADNWTGGGVMMSETQTYGMYEVRMKCTPGAGVSCIALLWGTNTWPPEIDFYEDAPTDNTREGMSATAHFSSATQQIQKDLSGIDMTQWHTYGVVWTPSTISYTVDGTTWASFANPDDNANDRYGFAGPMNLGLQIQVGDGAFPTSQTPSEVDLDVDWIVAYAQN